MLVSAGVELGCKLMALLRKMIEKQWYIIDTWDVYFRETSV